jgi:tetratricopeptide (TPR) repeat protein
MVLVRLACWLLGVCLLPGLFAQTGPAHETRAEGLLVQATELALHNRLAEAEPLLESAAELAPRDPRVLTELGKVQARLGETAAAIAVFRRALAEEPESPEAHLNLALALADGNQAKEALQEVDTVIRLDPGNGAAFYNRGRLLADQQKNEDAAIAFARATRLSPKQAEAWYDWALIETGKGNEAEASRLLQKVVALQPRNGQALCLLGKSFQQQGRQAEAKAAWERALAIDPNDRESVYALALALRQTNPEESKRLLAHFADLQRQKEKNDQLGAQVSTLGNHAYVAMQAQDWPTATSLLGQAIAVCGQCNLLGDLHKNLGLVDCHVGDMAAAKRELDQALLLKPNDRDIVRALEWVSRQNGAHE